MKNRSRLTKRLEKQSKKNFFLSLLGIIAVIFLIIKFGVPFLANATLFISGSKDNMRELNNSDMSSYIAVPKLDTITSATNSANIKVSGEGSKDQTIALYINKEITDKTTVDKKNKFVFENVELNKGENIIQVRAIEKDKKSAYSEDVTIIYKKDPPSLSIDSPSNDQSFSKDENTVKVTGKTDANAKVTVNDHWTIVDENGNFSYNLPLQSGENKIKIAATDEAGNKKEEERKVTYSP